MNKIFTLIIALCSICAIQAQTVKIYKDGNVVAQFGAADFDQVVFAGSESAFDLSGSYFCDREVSIVEMPSLGVVMSDITTVEVSSNADGTINLTFPDCYYEQMSMTMPGLTLTNVSVTNNEGVCSFEAQFDEVEAETQKTYSGTVSGSISTLEHWKYEFTVEMKYGSMPYTLLMEYISNIDL